LEVITICDHLVALSAGQAKGKLGRKSPRISPDGLVEDAGLDAVDNCQIRIDDYPMTANGKNAPRNTIG
jgi:hypothetical protein